MQAVDPVQMQQLLAETARRHRWTTVEYRKLTEAGVFAEDDRIELIEGELIEMAPIGEEHAGQVNLLGNEFSYRLYGRVVVSVQNPITLDEYSDPQPDIALLRWRADFYRKRRPEPEDILLIVEVTEPISVEEHTPLPSRERGRGEGASLADAANVRCHGQAWITPTLTLPLQGGGGVEKLPDTSVPYDREVKLPLYARFGIPECWLVDLRRPCLEVHRDPTADGYRDITTHRSGTVAPGGFPEVAIDLARLLGGVA